MSIENYTRYREPWMNDAQWECYYFIARLFYGFHHLHGKIHPCGPDGIRFNSTTACNMFATFDFDAMTRAVIAAHDEAIRFAIEPSGPGMLGLLAHKRQRTGDFYERHPTIEAAIDKYRGQQ